MISTTEEKSESVYQRQILRRRCEISIHSSCRQIADRQKNGI
jgi:hypothetical protein